MNEPAPPPRALEMLLAVFRRHPEVASVKLFGSRAKGTHRPYSDVDLAVWGEIDLLAGAALAADLEELPLPYHFDVIPFEHITHPGLRDQIERVGIEIYPDPAMDGIAGDPTRTMQVGPGSSRAG